jgi:hypothetical protein
VAGALRLPITQGDFVTTYGDFKKRELVTNAVKAIHDLHESAAAFGDPAALWKEWAEKDLTTADKPNTLYGKIVWVAGQIMSKAETFKDTYETLEVALDPSKPEAKRIESLKQILTGKGGLTGRGKGDVRPVQTNSAANWPGSHCASRKNQEGDRRLLPADKAEIYKEAEEALA